jgi:hypothetical protein
MSTDIAALRITEATQDYAPACLTEFARWVNSSDETINALSRVNSQDAMILGFAIAMRAVIRASQTEDAGRAMHAAWVRGMQHQHRDVTGKDGRRRDRWELLINDDKDLDSGIARDVARFLVETVGGKVPDLNGS